jgi:hypothetical protein
MTIAVSTLDNRAEMMPLRDDGKRRRYWPLVLLLAAGIAFATVYSFNNCECNPYDPLEANDAIAGIFNAQPGSPARYVPGDFIKVCNAKGDCSTYVYRANGHFVPCFCDPKK